ncbi:MAG TPA: HAD family hydrolase [Woeseiaceae bacterium]|nr:HAD family hydrolase [Woeseiaceae bacterium]
MPLRLSPVPKRRNRARSVLAAITLAALVVARSVAADPLPSWNDTHAKRAILEFVERVTREGEADYVPPEQRIAAFDNDGTLWAEQPMYAQLAFALDRVRQLASRHSDWRNRQPFKGVLEGDIAAVQASGERGMAELIAATHAGTTTEEFAQVVASWIRTARHPRFDRPYTEMVYQPMLEVLDLLRKNDFDIYIVSGGGAEFMRPWVRRVYGVSPEHVIGSRARVEYRVRDGKPVLVRLAAIDLVDDGAGKPVGIHQFIGRPPLIVFGNSDGDFEMLEWATAAPGPRLGVLVHHTDGDREWAYDRGSRFGALARGLDEAPSRGWIVVDMQRDWTVIFPFQR